jgi:hypothetical protein
MYCENCKKQVVVYGVSYAPGVDDELEKMRKEFRAKGILLLFNPPPFEPYYCPVCNKRLKME